MIDIHCHILPGLDDGSADLDESLAMAQLAVASGVTEIVTTPHFRGDEEGLAVLGKLLSRYNRLETAIRRRKMPLRLHPGAEILCLPATPRLARQGQLPTLGNTNYLLVEFFFDETAEFMNNMLSQLAACGYRPVIAHPERYEAVQKTPQIVDAWFRTGYIIQANKGSPLGAFGSRVQQTAAGLLEAGLVHLFASDAHSISRRTTDMRPLRKWLTENCHPAYVQVLLQDNPTRLIRGEDMVLSDG